MFAMPFGLSCKLIYVLLFVPGYTLDQVMFMNLSGCLFDNFKEQSSGRKLRYLFYFIFLYKCFH